MYETRPHWQRRQWRRLSGRQPKSHLHQPGKRVLCEPKISVFVTWPSPTMPPQPGRPRFPVWSPPTPFGLAPLGRAAAFHSNNWTFSVTQFKATPEYNKLLYWDTPPNAVSYAPHFGSNAYEFAFALAHFPPHVSAKFFYWFCRNSKSSGQVFLLGLKPQPDLLTRSVYFEFRSPCVSEWVCVYVCCNGR